MHSLVKRSMELGQSGECKTEVPFKEWSKLSVTTAGPAVTIKYFILYDKKIVRYSTVPYPHSNAFYLYFYLIIFPSLPVSSAFDALDWCLSNQGRLPRSSEGLVASTFVLLLQTGTKVLSYRCIDSVVLIRLIGSSLVNYTYTKPYT